MERNFFKIYIECRSYFLTRHRRLITLWLCDSREFSQLTTANVNCIFVNWVLVGGLLDNMSNSVTTEVVNINDTTLSYPTFIHVWRSRLPKKCRKSHQFTRVVGIQSIYRVKLTLAVSITSLSHNYIRIKL